MFNLSKINIKVFADGADLKSIETFNAQPYIKVLQQIQV